MEIIKKLLNWFKESNRSKHAFAGIIIFIAMCVVNAFIGIDITQNIINAILVVVIAMLSVEYKDHLYGGKFDCYDIIAGVSLVTVANIIVYLITKIF